MKLSGCTNVSVVKMPEYFLSSVSMGSSEDCLALLARHFKRHIDLCIYFRIYEFHLAIVLNSATRLEGWQRLVIVVSLLVIILHAGRKDKPTTMNHSRRRFAIFSNAISGSMIEV